TVEPDENGVFYYCINPACPAQLKERLRNYARRNAMDIEGLGTAIIDQVVEAGLVRSIPDLYRLTADQLLQMARMGKKSAQKLLDGTAASTYLGLAHLL